jgi:hypothetical protein
MGKEREDDMEPITTSLSAARPLQRLVDDLYDGAKGAVATYLKRIRAPSKVEHVYRECQKVERVKTILAFKEPNQPSQFLLSCKIKYPRRT